MKVSGIYKIVNVTNQHYYVGSSKEISIRWKRHKKLLINDCHTNDYLQRAWNRYGPDNFDFIVVEEVAPELLLEIEQRHLDIAKLESDKCYNLCFTATGSDLSPYSIEKIRVANTGRIQTDTTKQKLREIRSRQVFSSEAKTKQANFLRQYVNSGKAAWINPKILTFYNVNTKETFVGRRIDFIKRFNLNPAPICDLVNKLRGRTQHKGWTVTDPIMGVVPVEDTTPQ